MFEPQPPPPWSTGGARSPVALPAPAPGPALPTKAWGLGLGALGVGVGGGFGKDRWVFGGEFPDMSCRRRRKVICQFGNLYVGPCFLAFGGKQFFWVVGGLNFRMHCAVSWLVLWNGGGLRGRVPCWLPSNALCVSQGTLPDLCLDLDWGVSQFI